MKKNSICVRVGIAALCALILECGCRGNDAAAWDKLKKVKLFDVWPEFLPQPEKSETIETACRTLHGKNFQRLRFSYDKADFFICGGAAEEPPLAFRQTGSLKPRVIYDAWNWKLPAGTAFPHPIISFAALKITQGDAGAANLAGALKNISGKTIVKFWLRFDFKTPEGEDVLSGKSCVKGAIAEETPFKDGERRLISCPADAASAYGDGKGGEIYAVYGYRFEGEPPGIEKLRIAPLKLPLVLTETGKTGGEETPYSDVALVGAGRAYREFRKERPYKPFEIETPTLVKIDGTTEGGKYYIVSPLNPDGKTPQTLYIKSKREDGKASIKMRFKKFEEPRTALGEAADNLLFVYDENFAPPSGFSGFKRKENFAAISGGKKLKGAKALGLERFSARPAEAAEEGEGETLIVCVLLQFEDGTGAIDFLRGRYEKDKFVLN